MSATTSLELTGARGRIVVRTWPNDDARYVALIAHGYGEHAGRYDHVGEWLVAHGAAGYAPDHIGHGRSEGERALVEDVEDMVSDLHAVADHARGEHPGLPVVLIGHSMGGIIATRFAQRYGDELSALVLSAPVIGGNPDILALLEMDPIPDVPIDPELLSRDPEVGRAYTEDPLVYHGPFKRRTLESMGASVLVISEGPALGKLPTLWIHGDEDGLAPLEVTRPAVEGLRAERLEQRVYPGARHEIFNETNKSEVLGDVTTFVDRVVPT